MKAECYLKFTLQDMVYLDGVTAMLKEMGEKVTEPEDLKVFFEGRHSSYKTFRDSCLQSLFIKKYLDTYREVMKESDPVYFVVVLLPCPAPESGPG
ncbi:hypothetical protein SRHO_G00033410 [Serrasalmus rhombeus]